jgi:hypothetical protein
MTNEDVTPVLRLSFTQAGEISISFWYRHFLEIEDLGKLYVSLMVLPGTTTS